MKHKCAIGIVAAVVLLTVFTGGCFAKAQEKKLINFGWDIKTPADLAKDIDTLQDLPFDGTAIRAIDWCYPFYSKGMGSVEPTVKLAKDIKWGKFTDNFMYMTAGAQVDCSTMRYGPMMASFQVMLEAPSGSGVDEQNLTLEEKLRRERLRERGLGITRYFWSKCDADRTAQGSSGDRKSVV